MERARALHAGREAVQLGEPLSAVYNVGVPGADAYALANVITPDGTTISIAADGATGRGSRHAGYAVPVCLPSPTQRIFLVDGP